MTRRAKPRKASGADRAYWLTRLKRERPDLHERVRRRELSAFAATVEAGWRRRPEAGPIPQKASPGAERPRWAYLLRRGNIDADGGYRRPPDLIRLPVLGWTVTGLPIVGTEKLGDPEQMDWTQRDLPLTLLLPQSDGVGFYNEVGLYNGTIEWSISCPPIELDLEYIPEEEKDCEDLEIGWRRRRELGCAGHDRILLDEAEAQALFADYQRRWRAATAARERYVAECRAAAERNRQEEERRQQERSSGRRAESPHGGRNSLDPLREAAAVLDLAWPCTAEAVRVAHRRLARGHHPDHHGAEANDRMGRINAARDVLLGAIEDALRRA